MASTLDSDVFVPEVATAVATAQFANKLAVSFAGSPFVAPFPPEAELGDQGDTVKFPRWDPMGEMSDLTEDSAMSTEKMAHSVDTATVDVGGKAVEITDWASLAAKGDPSTEAGRQMATLATRYVDTKLITEAETTTLTEDASAGTITYDAFVDALITHFGDAAFNDIGGLVVHSKVLGDLFKLDEFKSSDYDNVAQILTANRNTGDPVGVFGAYPVYVSDRISVTTGTPDTYDNLILKRGALGLKRQRNLLVERDRDILKKSWVVAGDVRISTHLLFADPLPCIKFTTQ